ncbi:unnamed protein product [Soboliphyme baturini]|uniref:VWFA domain-containing protein n=1 Tax=Soboliphyme baturini TaxID=241478 RepID=A0A183IC71_9BILA|nr:unnamed protein product [Soboliphyme baturini]
MITIFSEKLNREKLLESALAFPQLKSVYKKVLDTGMDSVRLVIGIDYSRSNLYQGEISFRGKSLHTIEKGHSNLYQQAIHFLGKALQNFVTDGILVYGFADARTAEKTIFSLNKRGTVCHSFNDVLRVYNETTPRVTLGDSTNFVPLIKKVAHLCKHFLSYHLLVIIADGQVTNDIVNQRIIAHAARYPISMIMIGIGDGPWDLMKRYDYMYSRRRFPNFHFINFQQVLEESQNPELDFATEVLEVMEQQYVAMTKLGYFDGGTHHKS